MIACEHPLGHSASTLWATLRAFIFHSCLAAGSHVANTLHHDGTMREIRSMERLTVKRVALADTWISVPDRFGTLSDCLTWAVWLDSLLKNVAQCGQGTAIAGFRCAFAMPLKAWQRRPLMVAFVGYAALRSDIPASLAMRRSAAMASAGFDSSSSANCSSISVVCSLMLSR